MALLMRTVTRPKTNKRTTAIGTLIEERLRARMLTESSEAVTKTHLDEDILSAFVEARLTPDESSPVVSHLISCGVCRRTTAQLVRLEFELADSDEAATAEEHPNRLSSFLNGLAAHLAPPSEGDAVFAYQNPETPTEGESSKPVTDPDSVEEEKST